MYTHCDNTFFKSTSHVEKIVHQVPDLQSVSSNGDEQKQNTTLNPTTDCSDWDPPKCNRNECTNTAIGMYGRCNKHYHSCSYVEDGTHCSVRNTHKSHYCIKHKHVIKNENWHEAKAFHIGKKITFEGLEYSKGEADASYAFSEYSSDGKFISYTPVDIGNKFWSYCNSTFHREE